MIGARVAVEVGPNDVMLGDELSGSLVDVDVGRDVLALGAATLLEARVVGGLVLVALVVVRVRAAVIGLVVANQRSPLGRSARTLQMPDSVKTGRPCRPIHDDPNSLSDSEYVAMMSISQFSETTRKRSESYIVRRRLVLEEISRGKVIFA